MNRVELKRRLDGLKVQHHAGEMPRWLHRELRRGAQAAYRLGKPVRRKARRSVQTAISQGLIKRPELCDGCGCRRPLEAHHPDYNKPLKVQFLCSRCHTFADLEVAMPGRWWHGRSTLLTEDWMDDRLAEYRKGLR